MNVSVPQLEVYYIEFAKKEINKQEAIRKGVASAGSNLAVTLASLLLPGVSVLRLAMLPLLGMGISYSQI